MNITEDLLHIVEQAHSLERILEAAKRVVCERLRVDDCLVFLIDERGDLAQTGLTSSKTPGESQVADAKTIAAQVAAKKRVVTACTEQASFLGAPMLLRDTILGTLVLWQGPQRGFTAEQIETAVAVGAQLVGIVENARIITSLDRGEHPAPRIVPRPSPSLSGGQERILRGVGASPGVAIGSAAYRGGYQLSLTARQLPSRGAAVERALVHTAFEKARNDILRVQNTTLREIDEEHALIFSAHLLLLNDPSLLDRIDGQIVAGTSAPVAIEVALVEMETVLGLVPDAYIQEKAHDVDDLRSRLLDHALENGRRQRFEARIVLSNRVPPSLVIELKTEGAQALVTQVGGALSHGVLLARALGIPTVTGVTDMQAIQPDDTVIVDGSAGVVVVRPTAETLAHYKEKRQSAERARTEHAKYRRLPARTADGEQLTLHANIAVASDITLAHENGAVGIGLYRTEFPFIIREAFPTLDEQVRIYSKAYDHFPNGPIHFRILDLGGDKFITRGAISGNRSAFHGYRSLRVLFDHPHVFCQQVLAFALAARQRPLSILIPMVTSIEELRRARTLIDEALANIDDSLVQKRPQIGAMIEVPAAVELAADIAKEVDFLSIGTNDLMQYTLVVDREDSRMNQLCDPYHPAILRMIARVVTAAHNAGKKVSVCGEIAARSDVAMALIALGVDALSVVPTAIPELKQAFAGVRLEPMRDAINGILALSDGRAIAIAIRQAQLN